MKVEQLSITNVIGVRRADIRPTVPVTMIAGANGAGKTSLRDAVALWDGKTPPEAVAAAWANWTK